LELRDAGKAFSGKGVDKAINNINKIIAKQVIGMDVFDQKSLDWSMIELDGTDNKSKLGANALLGVSGAAVKAAAASKNVPVYKYVALLHKKKGWKMPKAMFNIINGGEHGDTNLDVQEFMVVPSQPSMSGSIREASEIFHALAKVLKSHRLSTNLGNEGGYSPVVESNKQVLDLIAEAGKTAGYELGKDFGLALDVAATELYQEHDGQYVLNADKTALNSERFISLLKEWTAKYSIISIEDPLAEEDWEGWVSIGKRIGSINIVGDDLFVTQKARLQKGIGLGAANSIIIKPNQVGTITETLETVALAQKNKYKVIVSHRSGETTDDFIADFAVGVGADYVKFGSVARGERVVKYNRLMKIEEEIKRG
jgi:enolase